MSTASAWRVAMATIRAWYRQCTCLLVQRSEAVKSVNIRNSNISPGEWEEQTPAERRASPPPGRATQLRPPYDSSHGDDTNHAPAGASPKSESGAPDPDIPSARDRSAHSA